MTRCHSRSALQVVAMKRAGRSVRQCADSCVYQCGGIMHTREGQVRSQQSLQRRQVQQVTHLWWSRSSIMPAQQVTASKIASPKALRSSASATSALQMIM